MRLIHCIDHDDDDWNFTCPYFSKHACCKHTVRFKKHVLQLPMHPDHDMRVLAPKPKRGRRKNSQSALVIMEHDPIVQNAEENAMSSDDDSKTSIFDMVLDECAAVAV